MCRPVHLLGLPVQEFKNEGCLMLVTEHVSNSAIKHRLKHVLLKV